MDKNELRTHALRSMTGGVWHTTSKDRYEMILQSGSIKSDPEISEKDRWATRLGSNGHPFVRQIGGVSLFDFRYFDPERYSSKYRLSNWEHFVPYRDGWGESIWIEIDLSAVSDPFIGPDELTARWKREKAYSQRIMPMLEAAIIGEVPLKAFRRLFKSSKTKGWCEFF